MQIQALNIFIKLWATPEMLRLCLSMWGNGSLSLPLFVSKPQFVVKCSASPDWFKTKLSGTNYTVSTGNNVCVLQASE